MEKNVNHRPGQVQDRRVAGQGEVGEEKVNHKRGEDRIGGRGLREDELPVGVNTDLFTYLEPCGCLRDKVNKRHREDQLCALCKVWRSTRASVPGTRVCTGYLGSQLCVRYGGVPGPVFRAPTLLRDTLVTRYVQGMEEDQDQRSRYHN